MASRQCARSRHLTATEDPPAKKSRRPEAPSGGGAPVDQGAARCTFSSPIPVEPDARAAERLDETASGSVADSQVEETSCTAEHLSVATGLPSGLVESLTQLTERILPFANGNFRPSPPPTLLEKLTDQLLVVISDAVAAVAAAASPQLSGVATQRLVAWVAADARGAATPLDKALAATVGKRLEKQAQKVREMLTSASAHAAEAREAAREAAAQDTSLVAALPAELAGIDDAERKAYARARNEVYVGFHELGSGSTAASGSLSVSVDAPPQLPGWVSEEPEEGPAKDELLKRALARIIDQEVVIDQLRETNEWQESCMRRERLRMQQRLWEQERVQATLNNELWDADRKLSAAELRLEEMDEECVRNRFAELERDLARSRMGNDVLHKRVLEEVACVRELEAEIARLKGED